MTHYTTLNVKEDASLDEIKKAYKKQAVIYHPDKAKDDKKQEYEKIFKKMTEAYEILSDNDKRKQYDMQRKGIGFRPNMNAQHVNDIFKAFMARPMGHNPSVFVFNQPRVVRPTNTVVKQKTQILPDGRKKIIKITTRTVNGRTFQDYEEYIIH
jgi:DnaJ-class molecular chaperone